MGLARGDILPVEVAVETDRGVDLLHNRVGPRAQASAPHFVAHDASAAEVLSLMTDPSAEPSHNARRRVTLFAVFAGGIAILAVLAGVYGMGGSRSNPAAAACAPAVAAASRIAPLARGEVAALAVAGARFRVADLVFKDAQGHERNLSDWRGRTVVLNLWATWCVPCRKEMPALDKLQAALGGDK